MLVGHTRLLLLTLCQRGKKKMTMTTRMRPRSTTLDQLPGISNLVRTLSRTPAPNTLFVHSPEQSTHHEDLLPGQVLSDNTHTHNTHHTISYLPVTTPTMTKHYVPASRLSFLLLLQLEAFPSQANLVPHPLQHPVASNLHLSAWSLNQ